MKRSNGSGFKGEAEIGGARLTASALKGIRVALMGEV